MNFWSLIFILICLGILFSYPKQIIGLTSIVTVIYYAFILNEKNILNNVKISIKYDEEKCSKTHPLFIEILNYGSKTIYKTRIGIAAYIPGYSNNIVEGEPTFSTDKIIGKNQSYFFCKKLPNFDKYSNITEKEAARAKLARRAALRNHSAPLPSEIADPIHDPERETIREAARAELAKRAILNGTYTKPDTEPLAAPETPEARKARLRVLLRGAPELLEEYRKQQEFSWPRTLVYKIIYKGIKLANDKYIYENSN